MRFRYDDNMAGFIELAPGPASAMTPEEFGDLLRRVPGVDRVIRHPKGTKTAQGNVGAHLQEHNWMVYSMLARGRGMEFEITRNKHARESGMPYTITAMFKHQADGRSCLEAWRILRAAVRGKELLPVYGRSSLADRLSGLLFSYCSCCCCCCSVRSCSGSASWRSATQQPGSAS
jgi:hypothetical protein